MRRLVFGAEVVAFVDRINGGTPDPQAFGIGVEQDGQLIGGVKFDNWNGASICMHVASTTKRWITKDMLFSAFDYPFNHCKAKKIVGLVAASNTAARSFDEHIGFVLEATIKDAHPDGDLLIYSMTADQCKYLR